jgi:hypothetical protein
MTTRRLDVLFCTSTDTLCQVCHVRCIESLHVGGKINPHQVHLFSTSYLHRERRAEIWRHVANTFCTDSFAHPH